jgi:putative ABC transport system permease protein
MKKTFIKKGMREIWAHKFQYFFLVLVLGLGIASYGSTNDMNVAREQTTDAIYEESNFMDAQVTIEYGEVMDQTALNEILSDPSISSMYTDVEYRLTYDVFLNHSDGSKIKTTRGMVIGYDSHEGQVQREPSVNNPLYFSDEPDDFSSPDAMECLVEYHFAKAYGISTGEEFIILKGSDEHRIQVLEKINVPEYFMVITPSSFMPMERSLGIVMMPIQAAMEIFGTNGTGIMVNDMVFHLNDDSEDSIDEFEERIEEAFESKGLVVEVTGKEENPARRFLYDDMENDKKNTATFPVIIFIVSGFGLIITLRRMIKTHRTQIGVFKSLGVPNKVILTYFLSIGIMIAFLGMIIGALLSIPMRMGYMSLLETMMGLAIVKTPISWQHYIVASIIGATICLVFTVVPARLALRIKPVDAIQSREGISKKKAGRIATMIGKRSKLPVPVKMTFRNLLRKPGRSLTTVTGISLSLGLFLSFMIMLNSVTAMIDDNLDVTTWDYEVTTDGFVSSNISSNWIEEYPEIEKVNTGIFLPTLIWDGEKDEGVMIYALENVEEAFKVEYEKGNMDGNGVILSSYLSDKMGLKVGDVLEADLPTFDPENGYSMNRIQIPVSGIHSNHIGQYMFMDLSLMEEITGLHAMTNIIYLHMGVDEEVEGLENMIITTDGVSSVTYIDDRENVMDQYFEMFVGVVVIMGLISVILSSAIVYNLFMIDAQEKKRDYATMKTLGTSLKKISYLIFIESTVVLSVGVIFGGLIGRGLAHYMFSVADEWEAMNLNVVFTWPGYIFGAILLGVVIYIVSILSVRFISRITIANVIRERSV